MKPAVSAGSRDTRRHARSDRPRRSRTCARSSDAQRSVLLQPYLPAVDAHGETALIFIAGTLQPRDPQGPAAARGCARHGGRCLRPEQITPRSARADELEVAERVLRGAALWRLTYARVDLIRDACTPPRLLELELTEPSLFLAHAPDAA